MDNLFHYLINNKFTNSTIILHCNEANHMIYILQSLLSNGFSPNVVKVHNQILLIEDHNLSLRFIDAQNYLNFSLKTLGQRITMPLFYFPLKWISKQNFGYSGPPPNIDDFFCFEDSSEDLLLKEHFIKEYPSTWSFETEFWRFLERKINILAFSVLDFIKEAFLSQKTLLHHIHYSSENAPKYLHPLSPPLFTSASYAFQLFLRFSEESKKIKTINNPIAIKSSKGELEFVSFLKWKYPNLHFEDSWSPMGQKDLYYSKPDTFAENKAWYYHGCFYHGHEEDKCKKK